MAAFFEIRNIRSLALPQIPIEIARNRSNAERTTCYILPKDHVDLLQSANASAAYHFHGQSKAAVGSLPGTHLDDASRLIHNVAQLFAFVDCQCQRLFAIDVLAGSTGIHHHFGVPVIGSPNRDDIDVLALKEIAIVFIVARRASERRFRGGSNIAVDIAYGHNVPEHLRFAGDHAALIAKTDTADSGTMYLCGRFSLRVCGLRPGSPGGAACRCGCQKRTAP